MFRSSRSALLPVLLLLVVVSGTRGEAPKLIPLWPKGAPGEKGDIGEEKEQPGKAADNTIRLTNVTQPTITVYRPAADKDTGTAVVICPGGGYNILAWNKEGTEVAEWLNGIG